MKVSLLQVASPDQESKADRIDRVEALISSQTDSDLVVLPELWSAGYFSFERYEELAEPIDGPTVSMCSRRAAELGIHIHVGSIVERDRDGRLRNTSVLVNDRGEVIQTYSKIHVFGYQSLESKLLTPGDRIAVTETAFGPVASTTCYDLRFPGLWSEISALGAQLAIVPAAWPAARREHWRLFTAARAVEHQLVVIACNAAGTQHGVELAGTSRVVDPSGTVLAEAGGDEEVLVADVSVEEVARARDEFPVLRDRLDDYSRLAESMPERGGGS